jgi:hypothetical protein
VLVSSHPLDVEENVEFAFFYEDVIEQEQSRDEIARDLARNDPQVQLVSALR